MNFKNIILIHFILVPFIWRGDVGLEKVRHNADTCAQCHRRKAQGKGHETLCGIEMATLFPGVQAVGAWSIQVILFYASGTAEKWEFSPLPFYRRDLMLSESR
jgi:hypothetical protein